MTSEQKYGEVLKELGALLADKNATISCQRWQIDELKKTLAKAEQELRDEQERHAKCAGMLAEAYAELDKLKGGAE